MEEFFLVQAGYDLDKLEDVTAHEYYHGLKLGMWWCSM